MKSIYAALALMIFVLASCGSEPKQPTVIENHPVHQFDTMQRDNTAVADSANGNANVGMGGGH